jgi:membrane-bound lytic murein transglycosylase D
VPSKLVSLNHRPRVTSALLVGFLALAGCAGRQAPVVTAPEPSVTGVDWPPPASADERPPVEELPPESLEPEDLTAATLEADRVDDPVSASPLDELAEVTPELTREELEAERGIVQERTPEFDIPVVVNEPVLAWVDRYSGKLQPWFEGALGRSGRYMELFRGIFAEEGLPQDLVYMAAVESGYKTTAYSRAHARGIFQFISATARRYGLRVDYWVDERADPEKSARAAAAYMKDLYAEFGDWHLAMAAYNAGEGKVRQAIARAGTRDFWKLARTHHLRLETRNHVPAILAAAILSKQPAKYGLSYVEAPPLAYDTVRVDGAADLRILAECAGTDLESLKELNPALRRWQTPPDGKTDLRVPVGSGERTLVALAAIPPGERVLYARHVVQRGDTLSTIASRYGVTVRAIQDANSMGRKTLIRSNQVLRVPTGSGARYASLPEPEDAGEVVTYRVRRGDTLYGIARRYGTTPAAIAAANDVEVNAVLLAGKHLKVVRGATSAGEAVTVARANGHANGKSQPSKPMIHTVRRGETLWQIAQRYATTVEAICSWNSINPAAVIRPGIKLTVGFH